MAAAAMAATGTAVTTARRLLQQLIQQVEAVKQIISDQKVP